ncbi:MAG: amino acid ABC transporter permease [Oscillospiraceae bacterium]|nr:amino acid ABC transporter permease [Oscillospiraceae bacterium]MBQ4544246.1 amino acid ABC transporter permease [Oscillospiraceae bacterium]MBQ6902432.1 amino acid ABC transporter permease [Oscillospiraceae bacterium]
MSTFEVVVRSLTEGFGDNSIIFAVTLLAAIPLGLIVAFGSMSKWRPLKFLERSKNKLLRGISKFAPIRWLTRTFVWIIRGTPLMLQIFVVLYAPGLLWDIPMRSRMTAVLIAFAINYAAYFSEIYRGGIEAIPKGQYEACQVLGMTKSQTFFKVVMPQVIKRIIPPMGNEIITLVKDTSLARVVAVTEIIMCAERFTKQGLIYPLFSTALYFLAFNGILTLLFGYIEKKLNYYRG